MILAFGGSLRFDSWNHKIAAFAANEIEGAELIRLRDYPLPVYDGDLEASEGLPENARRLKEKFVAADGLLLASPEYNGSVTGALKNVIDWVSRSEGKDEPPLVAFKGKVAGLLAASPGALGGLRGLAHLRTMLSGLGVFVVPEQAAVPKVHEAFAEDGHLRDAKVAGRVKRVAEQLADAVSRLRG